MFITQVMSYPNLSITGKPSPRTSHPSSAGKRRTPLTDNRNRNQSSNIFGFQNEEQTKNNKGKFKHESHSIVTKSKLEEIKDLTKRNLDDKRNIQVAAYRSPRKVAPDGVPTLSLDDVVGKDNDMSYAKVHSGVPKIHTPDSKDTFSWGTPLQQQRVKGGGWQVNETRKAKSASSSTRRKHNDVPFLDLKLSQSNEALGQMRQAAKEVKEDLQIEYLGASKLIEENSNKCKNKKQDFIEEAILQDQAMRMKILEERPTSCTPTFGVHQPYDARSKRHDALFNTKSVVTGVQDDLSKRFGFTARILSLNGHDAQRQLNGFFFISDNTLTMYEFRQFGTRANALPFIQRGSYSHVNGHRKNQPVCILDIATGKNLTLSTSGQPSLADRLKEKPTIVFRITKTDDEETRKKLLYHGCKTAKQKKEVDSFIQIYEKNDRNPANEALRHIQGSIRKSLESRDTKTMTTLFNHFKTIDKSGDGILNKDEIKNALQKFRVQISDQEFDLAWKVLDSNNDGGLDYGEFVRGFFGEMNEIRKGWVRKAFGRLDPNNIGVGDADNLYKFFCPAKHPGVIKGEMTESSFFEYLQDVFQISKRRKEIPHQIFEAYYEDASISIKKDEDFINLIKTTWTI